MHIGQANFALLIALISVVTTLLTVGWPLYRARGADIGIVVASTEPDKITFIVRNDGRSGGLLRLTDVGVTLLRHKRQSGGDIGDPGVHSYLTHDSQFVEPGVEQRITVALRNKTLPADICTLFRNLSLFSRFKALDFDSALRGVYSDIECTVDITEATFYNSETSRQKRISCESVGWVRSCVYQFLDEN